MKHVISILAVLTCLSVNAQTRFAVTGRVLDEKKSPIPGATVFLAGTKNTVGSDTSGSFFLANVMPGDYKLVVKVIGYKPLLKNISLRDRTVQLILQLEPDVKYLKSVTVTPDKSWLDNLEIFKEQFLGQSDNAQQCKIVNSGVLNFEYDKKNAKLTASTDDILIIRNQELGYKIKYVLLNFEYDEKRNSVSYQGFPSFEELQGTSDEESQWKENRRLAFLGSIHHFIRSVYQQNCKAQGFVVYKIKNRVPFGFQGTLKGPVKMDYAQVSFDSLLTVVDGQHKMLNYYDALYVIYAKDQEQAGYKARNYSLAGMYVNRRVPDGQVSIVNLVGQVTIDEQGSFQPTTGLYFEGYMGWKKIGDQVPFEYDPNE
jgi:hypothetical protein